MNDLSIGFLLITSPKDALFLAIYRKRIAIFIFFLSLISTTVGFSLISPRPSIGCDLIINLSFTFLWLFISSAILHLSCEIVGGCGNAKRLFLSLAISLFPLIFITPFVLICKAHSSFLFGCVFIFLWVWFLQFKFVKKLYSLSLWKTILAFTLPSIFFFFFFFILFLGFIGKGISEFERIHSELFFL